MSAPAYVHTRTAAEVAGVDVKVIRLWAHRGMLKRRGRDHRNRTLYLLADVLAVAAQQQAHGVPTATP